MLMIDARIDPAEQIMATDQRAALRDRAEREAKAEAASTDPATLEALKKIEDPAELDRFLRDNGGQGF